MVDGATFEPVASDDQFATTLFVTSVEFEVFEWQPFDFFKNWFRPVDFPA